MTIDPLANAVAERVMPAPPHAVYAEWLDPASLLEWMCPRPARCLKVALEPRIGGRYRIDIEEHGRQFYVHGAYTQLDPPGRIAFTWSCSTWPDPDLVSHVLVTFAPHGDDETLMTITHTALTTDLVDQHRRGWQLIADQLASSISEESLE